MSTRVAQIRNSALGARVIVVCALVLVASSMLKFWHPGPILTYLGSMGYEGADVYQRVSVTLAPQHPPALLVRLSPRYALPGEAALCPTGPLWSPVEAVPSGPART
jgi:hypothetical protein